MSFGSAPIIWIMSERKWQALPQPIQAMLTSTATAAVQNVCSYGDEHEAAEADALKKAGMDVITLADDQKQALAELLNAVADEWAKIQDHNGKAGTATLKAYREELERK